MTATVDAAGGQTLTPLAAAVDSLLEVDRGRSSRDELLDALRGLEVQSRRLGAASAGRRGRRPECRGGVEVS